MELETNESILSQILAPDVELEQMLGGFDFTEGPIWHPTERALIFSDIMGNSIYRWEVDGDDDDCFTQLRRNSYLANGNAFDHQGRVITCEHGTSRLTRSNFAQCDPMTNEGLEVLATHYGDKQLNSPNDVIVKSDGAIYFTDPGSGRSMVHGMPRDMELDFRGVYRLDPVTGDLRVVAQEIDWPNGLCFSLDESQLFVANSREYNIYRFDVLADGSLTNGVIWAETEGDGPGVPDGMKIDEQGNLYCCAQGGIHIFDPDGDCLGIIQMPEQCANLVFGDDDLCGLYITATTSVYRLRVEIPGHPTFKGVA